MRVYTGLRVACREDLREGSSQVASALRESQARDWSTQEPAAVVAEVLRLQSAMEAAVGRLDRLKRGAAPDGDESSEDQCSQRSGKPRLKPCHCTRTPH